MAPGPSKMAPRRSKMPPRASKSRQDGSKTSPDPENHRKFVQNGANLMSKCVIYIYIYTRKSFYQILGSHSVSDLVCNLMRINMERIFKHVWSHSHHMVWPHVLLCLCQSSFPTPVHLCIRCLHKNLPEQRMDGSEDWTPPGGAT